MNEKEFWEIFSKESLRRAWDKKDRIWDKITSK